MELQVQEFNLRSLPLSLSDSISWSWQTYTDWTNISKLSDTDWILELEVPFSGRAIFIISLLFVIYSKIHNTLTWKRSILPNFWVLVKICIYVCICREFDWKWGFWKTPFPISPGLEIWVDFGLGIISELCKVSSP